MSSERNFKTSYQNDPFDVLTAFGVAQYIIGEKAVPFIYIGEKNVPKQGCSGSKP
jgi:hypothetical protein